MSDASPRWDAGSLSHLQAPRQDRGDSAQPPAPEQVGEMRHFDRTLTRIFRGGGNRERCRKRPCGARTESLADGKFVTKRDPKPTRSPRQEPASHVERDGKGLRHVGSNQD